MSLGAGGVLDDRGALGRFDASGMLGLVAGLPAQLRDGWARSRRLALPERYRKVRSISVIGMGGSAIAGDLVRGIFADRLTIPVEVVRDYDLPAHAGRSTLVVAASFSGATEETISALASALERRCPVAVITTGGPLRDVAQRANLPLLTFTGEGQPRAAVGSSLALFAGLLEQAGVLAVNGEELEGAAASAQAVIDANGPDVPTDRNRAKQLAWNLVDRLPVIEAAGFLAPVARRWKTQLNENGKSAAAYEELPEATHNTVVGYEQPEAVRDHLYVVFLAAAADHPRSSLRASLSAELLATAQIAHETVALGGESRLAQAVHGTVLGDYVSVYLGVLYGLDPTPVEAISYVKRRLTNPDEDGGED